jgi:tetratricopeptide (TPR) repeat protein
MKRLYVMTAICLSAAVLGFAGNQNWEDYIRMGHESWAAGKRAEALDFWQRAYQDAELAKHPETLAALEFNRASALLWFGRIGEAEAGFRKALPLQESLYGKVSPGVASTLHSLAVLCVGAGRMEEAKMWNRRALEMERTLYGSQHRSVAGSLNILAEVLRSEGRQQEAASAWREGIAICERNPGCDWLLGSMLNNFGRIQGASEATRREAEENCLRGRLILEKALGPRHPYVAIALTNLADLERRKGKYVEAEALYRRALEIQREAWPEAHPDTAQTLHDIGWLMVEQRRFSEAASFFEPAARMQEALFGPDSPVLARTLSAYAAVLQKTGYRKQAADCLKRAQAIVERHPELNRNSYSVDVSAWKLK